MGLDSFLGAIDAASQSLSVVNRSAPDPVQRMLETTFADQPVDVDELSDDAHGDDVVVLTEQTPEGQEVVATSPLEEVMNTVLLVNSDLYKTGQANLAEFELPSVLTRLDDVPFSLRGYPESDKEKLLLVAISRYIERHAWRAGRRATPVVVPAALPHRRRARDASGLPEGRVDRRTDPHLRDSRLDPAV